MPLKDRKLSPTEIDLAVKRRREAMALHAIEGNPFAPETIAAFEKFEREGWPHAKRLSYIDALFKRKVASAAESDYTLTP